MQCVLCNLKPKQLAIIKADQSTTGNDTYLIECPNCGKYNISARSIKNIHDAGVELYVISAAIRYRYDRGEILMIDIADGKSNINEILKGYPIPEDVVDKADLFLLALDLYEGDQFGTKHLDITQCFAMAGASSTSELSQVAQYCREEGYLKFTTLVHFTITSTGALRLKELKKRKVKTNQAFVAMHFTDEMKMLYYEHLKPTLEQHGYKVPDTVKPVHNKNIDEVLIGEIERSSLMLVDLTDNRSNVHFETGLARAWKIDIIFAIRKDQNDAFDLFYERQKNRIVWKDGQDYESQLSAFLDNLDGNR